MNSKSKSILVASGNAKKAHELIAAFKNAKINIQVESLADLAIDIRKKYQVVEDGSTYAKNSYIKASALYSLTKRTIIADDSGLEIEELNNEPGIHSARIAETDELRIETIWSRLKELNLDTIYQPIQGNRIIAKGSFVTSICYLTSAADARFFYGRVSGFILAGKKGDHGFGYDPIFYYPPLKKSFAELTVAEKQKVSHRGQALQTFIDYLSKNKS